MDSRFAGYSNETLINCCASGDRHPMEWEFHKSYIPLERFRSKALAGWDSEAVEDPSVPETAFM